MGYYHTTGTTNPAFPPGLPIFLLFFFNSFMGLYDRDYSRYGESGYGGGSGGGFASSFGGSKKSITTILIIINVALFLVDMLFQPIETNAEGGMVRVPLLFDWMAVHSDTLTKPWLWWQFLTYGFAHGGIMHLGMNMLMLFFFGNTVEQRLGRGEFLRFYLVSIFLGGVIWAIHAAVLPGSTGSMVVGASGGVQAVTILFAFLYPQATVLLLFAIPAKAWVVAVGFAVMNLLGAISGTGNTAYDVHLAGMAFAAIYYTQQVNLGAWLPASWTGLPKVRRGPKLRLHDPDKQLQKEEAESDRILDKIHREGEASLTRRERKFMEKFSRKKRAQRGD